MQASLCEEGGASWSLRVTVRSRLKDNVDGRDTIYTVLKSDLNVYLNIY